MLDSLFEIKHLVFSKYVVYHHSSDISTHVSSFLWLCWNSKTSIFGM